MAYRIDRVRMASPPVEGLYGPRRLYAYDVWRHRDPEKDKGELITVFSSELLAQEWTKLRGSEAMSILAETFPEYADQVRAFVPGGTVVPYMMWLPVDLPSKTVMK